MFSSKNSKKILNIINACCIIMQSSFFGRRRKKDVPLYECGKIYYDKNSTSFCEKAMGQEKGNGVIV